jgi:hypothetical protein
MLIHRTLLELFLSSTNKKPFNYYKGPSADLTLGYTLNKESFFPKQWRSALDGSRQVKFKN